MVKGMVNFFHTARALLLDLLIPGFDLGLCKGKAFIVYSGHKSACLNGKHVSPLMDYLLTVKSKDVFKYITIGNVNGPESILSTQIQCKVNPIEFLVSPFFLQLIDIDNIRFLIELYNSPMLCMLNGGGRLHERRWFRAFLALRAFFLANYFSLKFRKLALECDEVYVLVYYNARMLGVISAFRKLGKEAWDVQHGYLGKDHAAYNNIYAFSIPSTYKPSGFVVWDTRFGKYIEATLGLPWESLENRHLTTFKYENLRNQPSFIILYSLQWGTLVPESVMQAVDYYRGVNWIFRMHPFDYSRRQDLEWIKTKPNCVISEANCLLVNLMGSCNLHITFNSGVVHEAAALGIESIFLDQKFSIRVEYEIGRGLAEYASDTSLIKAISKRLEMESSGLHSSHIR